LLARVQQGAPAATAGAVDERPMQAAPQPSSPRVGLREVLGAVSPRLSFSRPSLGLVAALMLVIAAAGSLLASWRTSDSGCLPEQGQHRCSGLRQRLYKGSSSAWLLHGLADQNGDRVVSTEDMHIATVLLRLSAGDWKTWQDVSHEMRLCQSGTARSADAAFVSALCAGQEEQWRQIASRELPASSDGATFCASERMRDLIRQTCDFVRSSGGQRVR
jgi:hypothetical protein